MTIRRIVIVGATSLIAQHCSRIWINEGVEELILVGRNKIKTERVAKDLGVRNSKTRISIYDIDFSDPLAITLLVDDIFSTGIVSTVLIAHGILSEQTNLQSDLVAVNHNLLINGVSPILFSEAFVTKMVNLNYGTISIIGSVAGDRGRKSNYIYGSAKAMIATYCQGLQHRLAGSDVKAIIIKPGPTETPMTFHLQGGKIRLAPVNLVALDIVSGIHKGVPVVYTPKRWSFIMLIIRHIPNFIFNRLDI